MSHLSRIEAERELNRMQWHPLSGNRWATVVLASTALLPATVARIPAANRWPPSFFLSLLVFVSMHEEREG